jgi:hypothetical protein
MPPRMSERTETSERVFCERVWKLTLHSGRPCPLESPPMPPELSERTETSERVFCERVWKMTFHPGRPCPPECSDRPPLSCRPARNRDDARLTFAFSHAVARRSVRRRSAAARTGTCCSTFDTILFSLSTTIDFENILRYFHIYYPIRRYIQK